MALNGIGVSESAVHAPISKQAAYSYRTGMGMIPSAEFTAFFDDFEKVVTTNVPVGWSGAIIDDSATVSTYGTLVAGAQGVLSFADATASEGAAIYLPKTIQLTVGKKFIMEARVRTGDVTDNELFMGLSDLTQTTNPEDLWTTTSANFIAWGLGDNDSNPKMLCDAGNSGTSQQVQTVRGLSVNTWHVLGLEYDGANLCGYVDGKLALRWASAASTVPTGVLLAPYIGARNGNGAGGNLNLVDYVRFIAQR